MENETTKRKRSKCVWFLVISSIFLIHFLTQGVKAEILLSNIQEFNFVYGEGVVMIYTVCDDSSDFCLY